MEVIAGQPEAFPGPGSKPGEDRLDALVSAMTLAEKVSLLAGMDIWRLPPLQRLGIPGLVMSDGPAGVRGGSFLSGRSVSFPCATALAATWDPDLVHDIGLALGAEARDKGVNVLLAPTVNLHRHPLGGRNFECFSEDPVLTARMAEAYITGVQANQVACCLKHLVCNDSEFERHTISSEVDDATLREMYLVPFETGAAAGVWSIMASYNRLNGIHTSEHPWLLDGLLRGEWAWDGVVVSDWFATHTTAEAMEAGLDVEMPGPSRFRGEALVQAVTEGAVDISVLDRSVTRVLRLIDRTVGLDATSSPAVGGRGLSPMQPVDREAAEALVRRAGARSMVLLKNDRAVLPLDPGRLKTVALIGAGADVGTFQGGGSAEVNPAHVSAILPALAEALGDGVDLRFERGCVMSEWPQPLAAPMITTPSGEPGADISFHLAGDSDDQTLSTETARHLQLVFIGDVIDGHSNDDVVIRATADIHPRDTGTCLLSMSGTGTVRAHVDGEFVAEGSWQAPGGIVFGLAGNAVRVPLELVAGTTRRLEIEFRPSPAKGLTRMDVAFTPPDSGDLQKRASELARQADVAVVVAGSPPGWESEGRDRSTMTLPGDQDDLIDAVATANPNTVVVLNAGAPVSMPWVDRVAAVLVAWFPGQEIGASLADVLTGRANPSGHLPTTFPVSEQDVASAPYYPGADGKVFYGERSNFGYRYRPGGEPPKPLFPFGHGLSYSRFELGTPEITVTGAGEESVYEVSVPVSHEGGPAGRQVVQVYVSSGRPEGPVMQMQGFGAVELEPGRTGRVTVTIPRRRLRIWSGTGWKIPPGPLQAWAGTSAADLPYRFELPGPTA